VEVEGNITGSIGQGLVVLLGVEDADDEQDVEWLARKIGNMRIFDDGEGHMNLSVKEVDGNALVVSQFTLHASTKKGNRPSFIKAAKPGHAVPLYEALVKNLSFEIGKEVATGEFGALMKVSLENDGPVTIIIDSKQRA
jgi:D-tyrosyl-tRNA(Tyr) deacylase